ncbi:MAG TPA: FecR domain-containing protein [Agriterribacter sp.]|nr:FecR domain-containing protein [Agriterribacter sp.]
MNYTAFGIEDLILDESFQNYCLAANEEDLAFWTQWIKQNPGKSAMVNQAKALYLSLIGNHSAEQFLADKKDFERIVEKHLSNEPQEEAIIVQPDFSEKPVGKKVWIYAAAIAATVAGILFFATRNDDTPIQNHPQEAQLKYNSTEVSKPGERKSIQLPDGSKVMLNAGSTINIAKDFNTASRELTLVGEAFFDVAHDAGRPFIIHTSTMDIKVLGTIFNVRAYPGDKTSETSLLKGSVEVTVRNKEKKKIFLHPNEKIILPNNVDGDPEKQNKKIFDKLAANDHFKITGLTYNKTDSTLTEVSWTENRLAFSDNSFETIAAELERWYNITISFTDEKVKQYRFTATFDQKNIEQVLQALQLSRYFKYTIAANNNIIISKN